MENLGLRNWERQLGILGLCPIGLLGADVMF